MLDAIAQMFQTELESRWLNKTLPVERPMPDGTWESVGTIRANVQHIREFPGSNDPDQATPNERVALQVFTLPSANVRRGYRVEWAGEWWHVATHSPPQSGESYLRLEVEQETTALAPITISVRRRKAGAWEDVGTFTVRRVADTRDPLPQARVSVYEANTATGATFTGVLIGDAAFGAVAVGDWFTIDGMPGYITYVDRSDPDRIEASYQMEARGT